MMKNEKDPMSKAIENNPCGLCRPFRIPVCKGHGGGSGGGGGGGSGSGGDAKEEKIYNVRISDDGSVQATDKNGINMPISSELKSKILEFQKIFGQQLSIEGDIEKGMLIFKIKADVVQKEEMRNLVNVIKEDCDKFMKARGLVAGRDYTANFDKEHSSLHIHIPNKELFKEFIEHLSENSLLLLAEAKQRHEIKSDATKTYSTPTPFDGIKGLKPPK